MFETLVGSFPSIATDGDHKAFNDWFTQYRKSRRKLYTRGLSHKVDPLLTRRLEQRRTADLQRRTNWIESSPLQRHPHFASLKQILKAPCTVPLRYKADEIAGFSLVKDAPEKEFAALIRRAGREPSANSYVVRDLRWMSKAVSLTGPSKCYC